MNCDKCGAPMMVLSGQKYHYTECGLDNVYLVNMDMLVCESCGSKEVVIPRMKLLHATLARAIALKPYPLTGAEIRFLRKQLRYKAKEFAVFLHIDASTLSRWENDEQQPGPQSDQLIRYVFFRVLEEKEGIKTEGRVAEQIAAASETRKEKSGVCINAHNPSVYSYC